MPPHLIAVSSYTKKVPFEERRRALSSYVPWPRANRDQGKFEIFRVIGMSPPLVGWTDPSLTAFEDEPGLATFLLRNSHPLLKRVHEIVSLKNIAERYRSAV